MDVALEYFHALLKLRISTLCKHLRNKAYVQDSDSHQNALRSVIYYELLSDELWLTLGHQKNVINAMENYLAGEEYDLFPDTEINEKETIYQYCQAYFERVDCPLGTSTVELKEWVATHADRQQIEREGFDEFFPNVDFLMSVVSETGDEQLRPVTDAELFSSKAKGFLRDIEDSNALDEFNQRMRRAHELLKAEAAVADVLTVMEGGCKPE